ncbi:STAS domain-containing protein [Actinoplanes couchii]|uniref:Anti-sigma factor antagonist n=1 Tax=Actinoplanes couchii TaxID=403638 RepID=A0ABQ3XDU5_9ACTN|nr:STAS domain-containing protein [Actinoplanes couchii]MDR6317187.1 anti-anti-sigma factor [Actinoplanes couchii]GID56682.1 anti-sigma factor antagonist [Actinoplanes couchii]
MSLRRYEFADIPATRLDITVAEPAPAADLLVTLAGELDADETEGLHTTLSAALVTHAPARLRLDASMLTFIDSGGVRALLQCHDMAARAGVPLLIERVHPNVYQVLEITGLVEILGATRVS